MILSLEERKRAIKTISQQDPIRYPEGYFRSWDLNKQRKHFVFRVWDILKKMYPDYYKKIDDNPGRLYNIPGDDNTYSMLNYLASNHTTFALIVNYLNEKIVQSAKEGKLESSKQLTFKKDKSNWEFLIKEGVNNMIDKYRYEIFQKGGPLFNTLIKKLEEKNKKGYDSEEEMYKLLKKVNPLAKDFKMGGHGKLSDMIDGIDIQFIDKGVIKTVQQKKCSSVYKGKNGYYVGGVGGIKIYDVTYMGFQTPDNHLYLFDNNNTKIVEYENGGKKYLFPLTSLKYEI